MSTQTFSSEVPSFFRDGSINRGMTYAAYRSLVETFALRDPSTGRDTLEQNRIRNGPLNLQRMSRVERTYAPCEATREVFVRLLRPQVWLVLSEPWCADSAQCVPAISALASLSPFITLRILLRDENPAIMDAYLTMGTRGIPKLVMLSDDGREVGRWGPRPREGQEIFASAIAEGNEKRVAQERLHLWYAKNRSVALETEIVGLLSTALQ